MTKEQLKAALESIGKGDVQAAAEAAEEMKRLPRTKEGLFDTSRIDGNLFEAARWVYPVYAAYETECNKKEGYPDLLAQMRLLDQKFGEGASRESDTACYLDALINTIDNVTPQLYEYYREMADTFKVRTKEAIGKHYRDGVWQAEPEMMRGIIAHACRAGILLAEKYEEYC